MFSVVLNLILWDPAAPTVFLDHDCSSWQYRNFVVLSVNHDSDDLLYTINPFSTAQSVHLFEFQMIEEWSAAICLPFSQAY
jgi:hypothetical protein